MVEFVNFEAIDEDSWYCWYWNGDDGNLSDNFIDDENMFDESVENYYRFDNVTRNRQMILFIKQFIM